MNKIFFLLHTSCMKKKIIAVLFAIAAVACIFAGCGAKKNMTYEKVTEPGKVIKREIPDIRRREFDGIMPVPPEYGTAKPMPLPAPHKHNKFNLR